MFNRFNVVLGLYKLSIPQKIEKVRFIVSSMTGNLNFPTPNPSMATMTERVNFLESGYIAAQGGGRDETALMHLYEYEVDRRLITLGHYVEDTANNNVESAEAVILSAGMQFKRVPVHTAREFGVKNTDMPGEVEMHTKFEKDASFMWQYTQTPDNAASWVLAGVSIQATFVVSGLTSEKHYFFRVAVVDKDGQGPWSRTFELLVL